MKHRMLSALTISFLFAATAQAQSLTSHAAAGKADIAMCEGCHSAKGGYETPFPEVYNTPMLNGQSAAYIAQALQDYRDGVRHNPTMKAVAIILTPQQITNFAAYYAVPKGQPIK